MSPRVPELLASQASALNTAQMLTVSLDGIMGLVIIMISGSGEKTGIQLEDIRDETGTLMCSQVDAAGHRYHVYAFDIDRPGPATMIAPNGAAGGWFTANAGFVMKQQARSVTIIAPAWGVGLTSFINVFGERR